LSGLGCWSAWRLLGLLARLIAALVHELVADVVTASGVELVALGDDRSARGFGDDGAVDVAQDVVLAVASRSG
jgi:hypothetical protein